MKRSHQGDQDEEEIREPRGTEDIILSEAKGKESFKNVGMQKELLLKRNKEKKERKKEMLQRGQVG